MEISEMISEKYLNLPADEPRLISIRKTLDSEGFACLDGFLTPEALFVLQKETLALRKSAVRVEGVNYKYALKGEVLNGTVVDILHSSDFFLEFVNKILGPHEGMESHISSPITKEMIRRGVGIMEGKEDVTSFHFDDTFLNMIVPAHIPKIEGKNRGQLVFYPNIKGFKRSFFNHYFIPALVRFKFLRNLFFKNKEVDYTPGNVYLFYGYRTFHGVPSPSQSGFRCITNITINRAD